MRVFLNPEADPKGAGFLIGFLLLRRAPLGATLEHLPDKQCLKCTLRQAFRCLKPGGRLIAMGPNIKYLPGLYWDFFDHHTILTEASLAEVLVMEGFTLQQVTPRFLPYTLVNAPEYPLGLLRRGCGGCKAGNFSSSPQNRIEA